MNRAARRGRTRPGSRRSSATSLTAGGVVGRPTLYRSEAFGHEVGIGDPALVYAEENELFGVRDGRFASSRERADRP
jgi:hypothetical protein